MTFNTGETSEELKSIYNPEGSTLRRSQLRMLEMVKFIDDICTKNNIDYFITAGNLIGAVRHGGFIPWDDDFDIVVSQKDLGKLKKLLLNQKSDFVLQCHKTDKGFVRHWPVLRDTKSEYIKDELVHAARKYKGLQVDIFSWESGVFKWGRRLSSLFVFFNEKYLVYRNGGGYKFLRELFFYFPEIFVVPVLRFFSLFRSKKVIGYGYDSIFVSKWNKDDVFPLKRITYEDTQLPAPNNPSAILLGEFGDDCKNLPPKNQRREHHGVDDVLFYD